MDEYQVSCYLKTVFPSRRAGRRRARQIRGEGGPRLRAYRCWWCRAIHLGRPPGQATHFRVGPHGPVHLQELTP